MAHKQKTHACREFFYKKMTCKEKVAKNKVKVKNQLRKLKRNDLVQFYFGILVLLTFLQR